MEEGHFKVEPFKTREETGGRVVIKAVCVQFLRWRQRAKCLVISLMSTSECFATEGLHER